MGRQRGPPVPRWRQLLRAGCRWLLSLSGTVLQGLWWLWRLVWVGTAGGGVSPFPKGLQALVSALNVACAQNQVLGHGVRGLPGVYRSVPVVPGSVVWCGWGRWGRRSPRHLTAWLEDQDPHLWELA